MSNDLLEWVNIDTDAITPLMEVEGIKIYDIESMKQLNKKNLAMRRLNGVNTDKDMLDSFNRRGFAKGLTVTRAAVSANEFKCLYRKEEKDVCTFIVDYSTLSRYNQKKLGMEFYNAYKIKRVKNKLNVVEAVQILSTDIATGFKYTNQEVGIAVYKAIYEWEQEHQGHETNDIWS